MGFFEEEVREGGEREKRDRMARLWAEVALWVAQFGMAPHQSGQGQRSRACLKAWLDAWRSMRRVVK